MLDDMYGRVTAGLGGGAWRNGVQISGGSNGKEMDEK